MPMARSKFETRRSLADIGYPFFTTRKGVGGFGRAETSGNWLKLFAGQLPRVVLSVWRPSGATPRGLGCFGNGASLDLVDVFMALVHQTLRQWGVFVLVDVILLWKGVAVRGLCGGGGLLRWGGEPGGGDGPEVISGGFGESSVFLGRG